VRRSLEESLERLQLDYVDAVLVHDPEEHVGAALEALESLRDLTSAVGVGTNSVDTALTFVRNAEIDHVLIAGRYTLLDASAGETLLTLCTERSVSVTAAGVFNSGLLCGGTTYDYRAARNHLVIRTSALAATCARYDVPLAAVAIQFPLRHPAVSRILVGARTPAEIEQDVALVNLPIPDALWREPLVPGTGASTMSGVPAGG
jgi:D-threo-aldose 1-dehydrogenase